MRRAASTLLFVTLTLGALEAQRGLQHEAWNLAPIKVRMGLHTGARTFLRNRSLVHDG